PPAKLGRHTLEHAQSAQRLQPEVGAVFDWTGIHVGNDATDVFPPVALAEKLRFGQLSINLSSDHADAGQHGGLFSCGSALDRCRPSAKCWPGDSWRSVPADCNAGESDGKDTPKFLHRR